MDQEKRRELVSRVQELYAREMPTLPLYYPNWYYAHNGQVNLFFTMQGIASGVPLPFNKMAFVR
jgi:peptide/nickel transport system substrate-binding protein